jgi:hypothetical protein
MSPLTGMSEGGITEAYTPKNIMVTGGAGTSLLETCHCRC